MKKLILGTLVAMAVVFASSTYKVNNTNGKSISKGCVTFTTEVKADSGSDMEQQAQMLDGMEVSMKFNGKKCKMEMNMAMMKTNIITKDGEEIYLLVNGMGQKMAIKCDKKDMKKLAKLKGDSKTATYTATKETKKILGYKCKKYVSSVDEDGKKYENAIWTTEDIKATGDLMNMGAEGLKGFPLETLEFNKGLKIHKIATKVSKDVPADSEFELPKGYDVKTIEELLKQSLPGGSGE